MKHSFIDRYADLDSPLHLLEARSKIIGFTALIAGVLAIAPGSTSGFLPYFFLAAIMMGVSQVPLNFIVTRTLLILPFVLLAAIAAPWKGSAGFTWFAALVMRSLLCLILLVILTNTTRSSKRMLLDYPHRPIASS